MLRSLGLCASLCLISWAAGAADLRPTGDPQILPPDSRIEELWNEGEFTEGVAVARNGDVYFSDIAIMAKNPGRIMKFDPKTKTVSVHVADSGQSNGLFFTADGRLLAACGANIGLQALCQVTPDGAMSVLAGTFEGKKFNSPNDLVVHPKGWVYFSDPRYVGKEPLELDHQSVFRYDADGSVHRATHEPRKPNGLIVSPDGKTLYVAETENAPSPQGDSAKPSQNMLSAYAIDDRGRLGKRTVLVQFGSDPGIDGMTIDVEGNIYTAVRKPARHGIIVYSPAGKERAYLPTDPLPTNCTFGTGSESKVLYITAGEGLYRIPLNIPGYHPELSGK